jgi:putative tryptophan/tyrosine transport system substrate-binding protein
MRRRDFISLLGGVTAIPFAAHAQQPAMPVVGYLNTLSHAAVERYNDGFVAGLMEAGYVDGKNVKIEYSWAEGYYDRLPALAADLVRKRVAIIFAGGDPSALAAKAATTTIPIVFIVGSDPVKLGVVTTGLNRPGGNLTGVNLLAKETEAKRLGVLHQLVPTATKLAVLLNPKAADADTQLSELRSAGRILGPQIEVIDASDERDIDRAFASLPEKKIGGLVVSADPFFNNCRSQFIALAARYSMPTLYFVREFASSGGLISYGTSITDAYHQVGVYIGKILSGAKPGDLPIVQPTKFELVINLKTAKTLGLTVPPTILATADEVIE